MLMGVYCGLIFLSSNVNWASYSWNKVVSNLTFKFQGQGHGCDQKLRWYSTSYSYLITKISDSWKRPISKSYSEISKVKVMPEVKVQSHIIHLVSNWCTSFSLLVNWTKHSWDNKAFDFETIHLNFFLNTFGKQTKNSNRISPKSNQQKTSSPQNRVTWN